MRMGIKRVAEKGEQESGLCENLPAESPGLLQPFLRKSAAKTTPQTGERKPQRKDRKTLTLKGTHVTPLGLF